MPVLTRSQTIASPICNSAENSAKNRNSPPEALVNMSTDMEQFDISPLQGKTNQQEIISKLNMLINVTTNLTKSVSDMKDSLVSTCNEMTKMKSDVTETQETVKIVQKDVSHLTYKYSRLKTENCRLHDKIANLEAQSRRDNLKFDGFVENDGETNEDCENKLYHFLQHDMSIPNARDFKFVRVHRVGPKPKDRSSKPRKIIAKFHWFKDREIVWKARRAIPKTRGIFISEDWPAEIEQKRRILDPVAKEARKLGHRAGLNVDKLFIDDQTYTIHDVDRLPATLHPSNLATKSMNNITAFFSASSPLSNFYPVEIHDQEDGYFSSSEQMFQYLKAKEFNDKPSMNKIKKALTPVEAFSIGRSIDGFDNSQWIRKCKQAMYHVCKLKFCQNPVAKQFLADTGDTILAEANPRDQMWSTGLSMKDSNIFQGRHRWSGENHLGEILTRIRAELD